MFFLCEKDKLFEAVTTVISAVSSKSPLPILKGILVNTDDNAVILTTNNMDMGIECRIPAEVRENGSAVIGDAKTFMEIVRKLPNDVISVDVDDNFGATIKCRKSVYDIKCLSSDEFPELPAIKEKANIKIQSDVLKKIVRQTVYAVSQRTDKLILTGSLFEIENNILTVVSLDGFRMALKKESIVSDGNEKFVVSGKALSDVARIIKDDETPVNIKITDKHIVFLFENTKVISRLLEGDFFNYKSIIPSDFKINLNIKLSDILTCVERADPIVAIDIGKNPIKITIDNSSLSVDCMTATGRVHDVIEIEDCGEHLEIGFNQKYIHEALAACDTDEVLMRFNGSLNPAIITPTEGDDFMFMVLPVKLSN